MKRTLTTLFVVIAIALCPLAPAARAQQQFDETVKVKSEVVNRLNKKEERVKVKLRNGSEVKGRITQTSDNGFIVTDEKTHAKTDIAYVDVKSVEGRGMSKTKKILIATGIGAGVLAILVIIAVKNFDPFENGITIR